MASLKARAEKTINMLPNTLPVGLIDSQLKQWLIEACERLSLLIPFHEMHRYTVPVDVPDPDGLDIRKYRFIRPNKDGRYAYPVPAWRKEALGGGYFRNSAVFPVHYIEGGMLHIEPEGGQVEALGIPVIDDVKTQESINQIPHVLEAACFHYAGIRYYMGVIDDLASQINQDGQSLAEVELGSLPTLTLDTEEKTLTLIAYPEDIGAFTNITFTEAEKESLSVTQGTIPGLDPDQIYAKVNISLNYDDATERKGEDDIEMLNGELNKLRTRLEEYQSQMQDEMNKITSYLRKYDADVNLAMQVGQIDIQKETQRAQINSSEEQFNRRMAVETGFNNYRTQLERFTALVQKRTAENQNAIDEFRAKIEQMVQVGQLKIAEFNALIGIVFQEFAAISGQRLEYFNARLSQMAANNQAILQKAELYGRNLVAHQNLYGEIVAMYVQSVTPERRAPQPREEEDVS